jgi:hypothetical protein
LVEDRRSIALGGERYSQRPTTVVLGSLVDANVSVILLQLLAKYHIVKARKHAHFVISIGWILCSI